MSSSFGLGNWGNRVYEKPVLLLTEFAEKEYENPFKNFIETKGIVKINGIIDVLETKTASYNSGVFGDMVYTRPNVKRIQELERQGLDYNIEFFFNEVNIGIVYLSAGKSIVNKIKIVNNKFGSQSAEIDFNTLPNFDIPPFTKVVIKKGLTHLFTGELLIDTNQTTSQIRFKASGYYQYLNKWKPSKNYTFDSIDIGFIVNSIMKSEIERRKEGMTYNATKIKVDTGRSLISLNDFMITEENSKFTIEKLISTMADLVVYDYGVDAEGDFFFLPKNSTVIENYFLGYNANDVALKTNYKDVKNHLTITRQGNNGFSIALIDNNLTSQAKYGQKDFTYQVPSFFNNSDAQILADALLEQNSEPKSIAEIKNINLDSDFVNLTRGMYRIVEDFKTTQVIYNVVDDITGWSGGVSLNTTNLVFGRYSLNVLIQNEVTLNQSFEGRIEKISFFINSSNSGKNLQFFIIQGENKIFYDFEIFQSNTWVEITLNANVEDLTGIGFLNLFTVSQSFFLDKISFLVQSNKSTLMELNKIEYNLSNIGNTYNLTLGQPEAKLENFVGSLIRQSQELELFTNG